MADAAGLKDRSCAEIGHLCTMPELCPTMACLLVQEQLDLVADGQAVSDAERTAALSHTSCTASSSLEAAAAEEAGIVVDYSSGSDEGSSVQEAGIKVEYSSGSDEGSSVQEVSARELSDSASDTDVGEEQPATAPVVSEADQGPSLPALFRRQQVGPSPVCCWASASTALGRACAVRHQGLPTLASAGLWAPMQAVPTSRRSWLQSCSLTFSGPQCLHALQPVQPGQQDAANDAAHQFPVLCLHCCTAHIPGQASASQPAAPGVRAHKCCLQACTARVLVRSLANQARAGALQHQRQLALELLKELHDKAEAGDWELEEAVKVGHTRFLAMCGSISCKGWLRGRTHRLRCRHGATWRGRQTGRLRSCLRCCWARMLRRFTTKPTPCLQEVDIDGLMAAGATPAATGSLSSGALEAAAGRAEGLGSVLEQAGRGGQLVLVQEQLQWSPKMVWDGPARACVIYWAAGTWQGGAAALTLCLTVCLGCRDLAGLRSSPYSLSVCLPLTGTSSDRDMNWPQGLLGRNMSAPQACHSMAASTRCTPVCLPWDPPA